MQNKLYTAGELAKMAGVSLRTIHFYDIKGLLCPVDYSKSGYVFSGRVKITASYTEDPEF